MNKSAQLGFTLLELMIVIAIIATISGFAIPGFNNYIRNQNLRQSQDQVKSDVRSVQIRALNGVKQGLAAPTYWGVGFAAGNTRYVYFITDVDSSGLQTLCQNTLSANWSTFERSESLPADIEVKSDACFFYSFESGEAICELSDTVIMDYPDDAGSSFVSINRSGTVYTYTGTNPIPVSERCP